MKAFSAKPKDGETTATKLADAIHYTIGLKRLTELIEAVLINCSGKEIKNDLIYFDLIFTSLEGLILRYVNFTDELIKLFDHVKAGTLSSFPRNKKNDFPFEPGKGVFLGDWTEQAKVWVAKENLSNLKKSFDRKYEKLFPNVIKRNEGKPNHEDLQLLQENLRQVKANLEQHRNTIIAHWADSQQTATFTDIKNLRDHLEELLGDLYSILELKTYVFSFGGLVADVGQTSKLIINACLHNEK